jgi:MFS family permease
VRTAPLSGTGDVHAGRTAGPSTQGAAEAPGGLTATAPHPPARPAAQPRRAPVHATLILAIICVSYFMVIPDNSIVFTGLPQIRSYMGFSETGLSWITNAYVLVFGGLLLLGARVGGLFGHRRVFLFSLVVFSLTSLLVGAAQSQWWLIGARALQGVAPADAGAGSGLVNTVHQIGSALSLSILTAVAATVSTGHGATDIAARSGAALTGSAVLLALAVLAVLTLIVPARATRNERSL